MSFCLSPSLSFYPSLSLFSPPPPLHLFFKVYLSISICILLVFISEVFPISLFVCLSLFIGAFLFALSLSSNFSSFQESLTKPRNKFKENYSTLSQIMFFNISPFLSVCLSFFLSVFLSVCLSFSLFLSFWSSYFELFLYVFLSFSLSFFLNEHHTLSSSSMFDCSSQIRLFRRFSQVNVSCQPKKKMFLVKGVWYFSLNHFSCSLPNAVKVTDMYTWYCICIVYYSNCLKLGTLFKLTSGKHVTDCMKWMNEWMKCLFLFSTSTIVNEKT